MIIYFSCYFSWKSISVGALCRRFPSRQSMRQPTVYQALKNVNYRALHIVPESRHGPQAAQSTSMLRHQMPLSCHNACQNAPQATGLKCCRIRPLLHQEGSQPSIYAIPARHKSRSTRGFALGAPDHPYSPLPAALLFLDIGA